MAAAALALVLLVARRYGFLQEVRNGTTCTIGWRETSQTSNPEQQPKPNPDRNAYFGEEHIHTSWSVDAWLMGNRLTGPDDALKYAQGQTIKHPLGYDIKIDTPMDFMGVTDSLRICGSNEGSQHAGLGHE